MELEIVKLSKDVSDNIFLSVLSFGIHIIQIQNLKTLN